MSARTKLRNSAAITACIGSLLAGCAKYDEPITYDVKYRGHSYIVFLVKGNRGQTYVHDPDCECNDVKKGTK
jgi:hypothetical protein